MDQPRLKGTPPVLQVQGKRLVEAPRKLETGASKNDSQSGLSEAICRQIRGRSMVTKAAEVSRVQARRYRRLGRCMVSSRAKVRNRQAEVQAEFRVRSVTSHKQRSITEYMHDT